MLGFLRRLFGRKKAALEHCSVEKLRSIKQEADHLTAAVNSTESLLAQEDMERLRRLTRTLEDINKRGNVG